MPLVLDGTNGVSGVDGTASNPSYEGTDSNTGIFFPAADTVAIGTGGTEALRVNSSQNVGIGKSSAITNLDVLNNIMARPAATSGSGELIAAASDYLSLPSYTNTALRQYGSTATGTFYGLTKASLGILEFVNTSAAVVGTNGSAPIVFATAGNERMRIDSSGNVGIGTTTIIPGNSVTLSNSRVLGWLNASGNFSTTAGSQIFKFSDNNLYIDNLDASTSIIFRRTSNTESMRIDGSGFTQFSSNLVMPYQGAPTSKAAAATLTGAELVTGILNTTGTTYTITLPTGTNIEGALTWAGNNVCLDFFVINTASGTITIGANGNTTLGALTIATGTSAHFRIRRTAANTFTVYRL